MVEPILAQLKQGITPEKISLTVALGTALGLFPILGTTTALCLTVGIWLKLNQPIIQLINWLVAPLQLPLILVFIRIGESAVRAEPVSFSIKEMLEKFYASPLKFLRQFGMTGLHGIGGWLLVAPVLVALLYFCLLPAMRKLARLQNRNESC